MKQFFNISYEFDREAIYAAIRERLKYPGGEYICVADGVILDTVNRREDYKEAVNNAMFSICDSSYVPLYIRMIYGEKVNQYSGSTIFKEIVSAAEHQMMFVGSNPNTLKGLKNSIAAWNPKVAEMEFMELPFCEVDDFEYERIADRINAANPDIIWISLGAPKQEFFMSKLKPYLKRGIMIAVGAAFKFYSGVDAKRAPKWMVKNHMEFIYRLGQEPRKQARRCYGIITSLPRVLLSEWRRKKKQAKKFLRK